MHLIVGRGVDISRGQVQPLTVNRLPREKEGESFLLAPPLKLYVAMRNRNVKWLEETLMAVSDPFSEEYGRYPSSQEVKDMCGPDDSAINMVTEWIVQETDSSVSLEQQEDARRTGYLVINLSLVEVEALLGCQLHPYRHKGAPNLLWRALEYSLPHKIAKIVDFVGGGALSPPNDLILLTSGQSTTYQTYQSLSLTNRGLAVPLLRIKS
jgi:hypothetical protein